MKRTIKIVNAAQPSQGKLYGRAMTYLDLLLEFKWRKNSKISVQLSSN